MTLEKDILSNYLHVQEASFHVQSGFAQSAFSKIEKSQLFGWDFFVNDNLLVYFFFFFLPFLSFFPFFLSFFLAI
jgi:hypothetical protein